MWEIDRINNKLISIFIVEGEMKELPAMTDTFPKARAFFFNSEITLCQSIDKNTGMAVFKHN